MKKEFVRFYSPGTFVSETTEKEIDTWDVEKAKEMAKGISERHRAKPYGFMFVTYERGDDDLNAKVTKQSNMYYLGGKIRYLEELILLNNKEDEILISNMRTNGWERCIENTNSYKITCALEKGDVVLDWEK